MLNLVCFQHIGLDHLIDQYNHLEQPLAFVMLDVVDQNGNYVDVSFPHLEEIPQLDDQDLQDILGPDDLPPPLLPMELSASERNTDIRADPSNLKSEIKDCFVNGFAQLVLGEISNYFLNYVMS